MYTVLIRTVAKGTACNVSTCGYSSRISGCVSDGGFFSRSHGMLSPIAGE